MFATQLELVTADEFWRLAEAGQFENGLFELVDGEIIEMAPPSSLNAHLASEIAFYLKLYVKKTGLGWVFGADGGYTLSIHEVRLPDVSYISKERLPELPKVIYGAPELAVEVISPSESGRAVNRKTMLYLSHGVKQVWNVYSEDKVVEVWRENEMGDFVVKPHSIGDILTGDSILPNLNLAVADIFLLETPPSTEQG